MIANPPSPRVHGRQTYLVGWLRQKQGKLSFRLQEQEQAIGAERMDGPTLVNPRTTPGIPQGANAEPALPRRVRNLASTCPRRMDPRTCTSLHALHATPSRPRPSFHRALSPSHLHNVLGCLRGPFRSRVDRCLHGLFGSCGGHRSTRFHVRHHVASPHAMEASLAPCAHQVAGHRFEGAHGRHCSDVEASEASEAIAEGDGTSTCGFV